MEAAAFPLLWGAERETAASPLAPSLFMERSAPALPKRHEASRRLLNPAGDRRRCGGHKAGWLAQREGVLPPRFLTRSGKTQLDNNLPTTRPDLRGSRCGQRGKKHQNVVYKWVFCLDISGSKVFRQKAAVHTGYLCPGVCQSPPAPHQDATTLCAALHQCPHPHGGCTWDSLKPGNL